MSDKRENALNAIRRKQGSKSPNKTGTTDTGSSGLNFYSGEVSSLKVQPKTVLVISLVYLGVVVLLHIWSKLRGGNSAPTDVPPTQ